jgi:glycerol-3-phosphate cytidylyltransferase
MKTGIIAGTFDVLHPGYIYTFIEAHHYCNTLIVALHIDPSIERPEKLKPILSVQERSVALLCNTYVDVVHPYETEEDLIKILERYKPDIRFLGDDYKGKKITGEELNIPIHYIDRSHGWSTTKFKKLIYEQINNRII